MIVSFLQLLLQERCRLFATARQNLNCDSDWTFVQTLFGVTTFYRREPDGSLSIKLEGKLKDVPLFDQVAVLREIDFYSRWSPCCSSSLSIAHLDKLDTVGWIVVGLPHFGLMRDGCFRAIGCDSIYEDGSVLLVAHGINDRPENLGSDNKHLHTSATSPTTVITDGTSGTRNSARGSVRSSGSKSSNKPSEALGAFEEKDKIFDVFCNDPILQTLDIPSPPTRMGSGRMTIKTFQALIHVESPTLATTKIVTNIDPNLSLIPQALMDFVMKRLCGVLLNKLQGAARKVSKDPITNPHAIRMREEEDFYKGWLMEKFKGVCKLRGWEMTPVAAFELTESQLDMAQRYISNKKQQKSRKSAMRLYHSMSYDGLDSFLESPPSIAGTEPAFVGRGDDLDGPKIRAVNSRYSDDMSELSKSSSSMSSIWRSNPIATYLREVEERTQLKKLRRIEQSRERAADRLKRKALDTVSQARLEELRAARARRSSGVRVHHQGDAVAHARTVSTAPLSISDNQQRSSLVTDKQHDWAFFWTRHGWFTRFVVIDFLFALLFCLLYMNTTFEKYVKSTEGPYWTGRQRDIAAIGYIGVTGLVHFLLCYVALMYAFSSLKVGMIAGKHSMKFYSQHVHLIVGCSSASLVVLGVLKTCSVKALQWIVWRSHVIAGAAAEGPLSSLPSPPRAVTIPIQAVYSATTTILSVARTLFLDSTIVGRSLVAVYDWLIRGCYGVWSGFVADAVDQYSGTTESPTWRADVFGTTRGLLAYSATFCLVVVLTFNLIARYSRSAEFVSKTDTVDNATSLRQVRKEDGTASASNIQVVYTRSPPATFESIDEDDELIDFGTDSSHPLGGSSSKKKRPQRQGI